MSNKRKRNIVESNINDGKNKIFKYFKKDTNIVNKSLNNQTKDPVTNVKTESNSSEIPNFKVRLDKAITQTNELIDATLRHKSNIIENKSEDYWKKEAQVQKEKAERYMNQSEFLRNLLLRRINESNNISKNRKILYSDFEDDFDKKTLIHMRAVIEGAANDREFVRVCIKSSYQSQPSLSKSSISQERKDLKKTVFLERLLSEQADSTEFEKRKKNFCSLLAKVLNEMKKQTKTRESQIAD